MSKADVIEVEGEDSGNHQRKASYEFYPYPAGR